MNKSNIEAGQAGTEEQQSTTAQNQQVGQPNANTNVVGIPFKSREIKFRAWLIPDDFESELPYMTYDLAFEDYAPVNEQLKSVSTLMQYTGLKDKNGNGKIEFYEGDFVSLDGNKIGNKYENPEIYKDTTAFLIEGIGTKSWRTTEKEAMDRGLGYAE